MLNLLRQHFKLIDPSIFIVDNSNLHKSRGGERPMGLLLLKRKDNFFVFPYNRNEKSQINNGNYKLY